MEGKEIKIQSGEGISQAIKRELKSAGLNDKDFKGNIWSQIRDVLDKGGSTLIHGNDTPQLIGDIWKPIDKKVKTRVNDTISIYETTWNEILGLFESTNVVVKAPEKTDKKEDRPVENVVKEEKIEETVDATADQQQEVQAEETEPVLDIEQIKRNEKRALDVKAQGLGHDSTILSIQAADLLVNVANMEDKPDVESGTEPDYTFQRVSLSNKRSIEVRTDSDGNRSVHVSLGISSGAINSLNVFSDAEVVYKLNPDGKSKVSVMYNYGEDDWEESKETEITNENFNSSMNAVLKKMFCE